MDAEFGISSLVEKEMKPIEPRYSSRDLKGLKVLHDQDRFKEGQTTILTLADKGRLTVHYFIANTLLHKVLFSRVYRCRLATLLRAKSKLLLQIE